MPTEKYRELEKRASGPFPLQRMPRPAAGERCHRCHGAAPNIEGCALCNPERLLERGLRADGSGPDDHFCSFHSVAPGKEEPCRFCGAGCCSCGDHAAGECPDEPVRDLP